MPRVIPFRSLPASLVALGAGLALSACGDDSGSPIAPAEYSLAFATADSLIPTSTDMARFIVS